MKVRKIFLSTIALAVILLASIALLMPIPSQAGKKKGLTPCEKEEARHVPEVRRFTKEFVSVSAFNPNAALGAIAQTSDTLAARLKFSALTPDKRRAVWQAKFDQLDISDYTDAQQAFLNKVIGSLPERKFDGTDDKAEDTALVAEARSLFKKSEFLELFGSLKTTAALMKAKAYETPECECNYSTTGGLDDFCTSPTKCRSSTCVRRFGCGWLWSWWCDGLCKPA